jgi:2-oxoglutarate/2-oxoacid ferredoxin oxidoreductase subunit beta
MPDSTKTEVRERKWSDYRSGLKPVWCPGCGDFGVLSGLFYAMSDLNLDPHNTCIISGIGCSSRLPGYVNSYGFNTIHGRALPIATGVILANPNSKVIVTGGDGDGFSIGMGHFPHAVRRNLDITYICMDNSIYGLTKGQVSPTTPLDSITKTTKYGSIDRPFDPVAFALVNGATFVARAYSNDKKSLVPILKRAINHKGFSFVNIISPCVTFRGEYFKFVKPLLEPIIEGHDTKDYQSANYQIRRKDKIIIGIFYEIEYPPYSERIETLRANAKKGKEWTLEDVGNQFYPK